MIPNPQRVFSWADSLAADAKQSRPPIDLLAIARHVHVKRIRKSLMVHRAAIVPVDDGSFDIYLRNVFEHDLDINGPEKPDTFSVRERFAVAHEVAHIWFHNHAKEFPLARSHEEKEEIEGTCDGAAGRMLVPTSMMDTEIKRGPGDKEKIDADFVISMAKLFNVSPEVAIERLRWVARGNSFPRGIVLVRRRAGEPTVEASYYGGDLSLKLKEPEDYRPLAEWFPDIPTTFIKNEQVTEWQAQTARGPLRFRKLPWGKHGAFIMQVDS